MLTTVKSVIEWRLHRLEVPVLKIYACHSPCLQVALRIRPLSKDEKNAGATGIAQTVDDQVSSMERLLISSIITALHMYSKG